MLEIHRIKNYRHYLNLAVLVARLRSPQFHVLDISRGEKVITHQAKENVHSLQFGLDLSIPVAPASSVCTKSILGRSGWKPLNEDKELQAVTKEVVGITSNTTS